MDRSTVSYRVALNLLGTGGDVLPLDAELHYSADDPLAVEAHFDDGSDEPIRWVFARDLLSDGMDQRTGEGDIVVWPTIGSNGEPVVHFRLHSPHGDAVLEASADALEEFVAATWRLVPPGTEHRHMDIDDALSVLLGEF
jgi:hypothetical protein